MQTRTRWIQGTGSRYGSGMRYISIKLRAERIIKKEGKRENNNLMKVPLQKEDRKEL